MLDYQTAMTFIGGAANRYARYVRVTLPGGIAVDGELRADGVALRQGDVQALEIGVSDGYQLVRQRLRFAFRTQ